MNKKIFLIFILLFFIPNVLGDNIILYPNTYAAIGYYDNLIGENVYNLGYELTDISNYIEISDYDIISVDDTNGVITEGTSSTDTYLYVNFTVNNVDSIEGFKINSIHQMLAGVPIDNIHLGLWDYSDNEYHSFNTSDVKNIDIELSHELTPLQIISHTDLTNNILTFSLTLWSNGGSNTDIFIDQIYINLNYTQSEIPPPPYIISYSNNITNNEDLNIDINLFDTLLFNITANQTINNYNWYKDYSPQTHNYNNISLSWITDGLKYVSVNTTNENGTSNTINWIINITDDTPPPLQGIIIFKDDLNLYPDNKISVYLDNEFIGIYNYNDEIYYNNSLNYTFVINNDIIDIINKETFLINIFKNYGYVLIGILGLILLIGIILYFYKKVK